METVEIRYHKWKMILLIILLAPMFTFIPYFVYFSAKNANNTIAHLVYLLVMFFFLYTFGYQFKQLLKNEPVLVISRSGIDINQKKPLSLLWTQIVSWEIKTIAGSKTNSTYLIVETKDTKRKIELSLLEKNALEIDLLMHKYQHHKEYTF